MTNVAFNPSQKFVCLYNSEFRMQIYKPLKGTDNFTFMNNNFFFVIKSAAAAEKYMNESLATCQMIHGPHHKQTLLVQDELARLYIRTDRNAVSYLIVISFLVGQFYAHLEHF